MAVSLGNKSVVEVAAPWTACTAVLLALEKICAKPAVGVPVHRETLALLMMLLKASASASETAPWTYWQFRQPAQLGKKPPSHMHDWWDR